MTTTNSKNLHRTATHPHGKLVTNKERTLAFVRISKCGSTTVTARHNLIYWDNFSDHRNTYLNFCAVRDPRKRFLSSIPETLCRLFTVSIPESKLNYSDVPISENIYTYLSKQINKQGSFVKAFMSCIDEYGFFDAHHEPMTNFLLDERGQIQINPIMINVSNIDTLSRFIYSLLSNMPSRCNLQSYNVNSDKTSTPQKNTDRWEVLLRGASRLRTIPYSTRIAMSAKLRTHRSIAAIKKLSFHPLSNVISGYPSTFSTWSKLKLHLYETVKSEIVHTEIDDFIKSYYSNDLALHASVSKTCDGLTTRNMLYLSKRLDRHLI